MILFSLPVINVLGVNQTKQQLKLALTSNVSSSSQYWVATTGSSGYPAIAPLGLTESSSGVSFTSPGAATTFTPSSVCGNGAENPTDLVTSLSGTATLLTANSTSGAGSDAFLIDVSNGSPSLSADFCDGYGGNFSSAAITPSGDFAFFSNANAATSSQFSDITGLTEVEVNTGSITSSALSTNDVFSVAVCGDYVVAGGALGASAASAAWDTGSTVISALRC